MRSDLRGALPRATRPSASDEILALLDARAPSCSSSTRTSSRSRVALSERAAVIGCGRDRRGQRRRRTRRRRDDARRRLRRRARTPSSSPSATPTASARAAPRRALGRRGRTPTRPRCWPSTAPEIVSVAHARRARTPSWSSACLRAPACARCWPRSRSRSSGAQARRAGGAGARARRRAGGQLHAPLRARASARCATPTGALGDAAARERRLRQGPARTTARTGSTCCACSPASRSRCAAGTGCGEGGDDPTLDAELTLAAGAGARLAGARHATASPRSRWTSSGHARRACASPRAGTCSSAGTSGDEPAPSAATACCCRGRAQRRRAARRLLHAVQDVVRCVREGGAPACTGRRRRGARSRSPTRSGASAGLPCDAHDDRAPERSRSTAGRPSARARSRRAPRSARPRRRAVAEVLDSGVLSQFVGAWGEDFYGGPRVRSLERAWAERFGVRHAVAMNSATSALNAAAAAAGVGPGRRGDRLAVHDDARRRSARSSTARSRCSPTSSRTRSASTRSRCATRITPRTKAIVAVDLFGCPADFERDHGDRARARPRRDRGRRAGARGARAAGARPARSATSASSASTTTRRSSAARAASRSPTTTGSPSGWRSRATTARPSSADMGSDAADVLGFNYRMGELEAAIAEVQLVAPGRADRAADRARRRGSTTGSSELEGITPPVVPDGHPPRLLPARVRARRRTCSASRATRSPPRCAAEGVPVTEGYVAPLYRQPLYRERAAGAFGDPRNAGLGRLRGRAVPDVRADARARGAASTR